MSFWEPMLALPVFPATALLALLMAWSLLAVLGGAVFHGHHVHVDTDASVDGDLGDAFSSLSSFTLNWLNLSQMPLMIWLGAFSILWWTVSMLLWQVVDVRIFGQPGIVWSIPLVARNLVISALLTKFITSPFRGWYVSEELSSKSLVGQECEICSSEATPEYGQVRFKTDGAPLLLNVRTDGPHLAKGARVWITHYDATRRAYIVSPTSQGD